MLHKLLRTAATITGITVCILYNNLLLGSGDHYEIVCVHPPLCKTCILVSCITDNFSVLIIVITEEWISISAEILPVFRAFPVQGPNITSRAVAREVMLGPKDRKCPKKGQNRGGNGYSSEGMSMISKLKLSVIHIILCYSRDFALPKTWFLSSCLTTKSLYVRFIF